MANLGPVGKTLPACNCLQFGSVFGNGKKGVSVVIGPVASDYNGVVAEMFRHGVRVAVAEAEFGSNTFTFYGMEDSGSYPYTIIAQAPPDYFGTGEVWKVEIVGSLVTITKIIGAARTHGYARAI